MNFSRENLWASYNSNLYLSSMAGIVFKDVVKSSLPFLVRNLQNAEDTQVQDIKNKLIKRLGKLCNLNGYVRAFILNSGSEANEIAIYLSRDKTKKNIIICTNLTHGSVLYAAEKLGMEVKKFEVDHNLQVDIKEIKDYINKNADKIAIIINTQGTSQAGSFENILSDKELINLCKKKNIWIHNDAAFSGLYNTLLNPKYKNQATSITIDPHKFIGVYGCSLLYIFTPIDNLLKEKISYFEGSDTFLGTTRSAFPLIVAYKSIEKIKDSGMKDLATGASERIKWLKEYFKEHKIPLIYDSKGVVFPIELESKEMVQRVLALLKKQNILANPVSFKSGNKMRYGIKIFVTTKPECDIKYLKKFSDKFIKIHHQNNHG